MIVIGLILFVVILLFIVVVIFLVGCNCWLINGLSVICSVINFFIGVLFMIIIYIYGLVFIVFG